MSKVHELKVWPEFWPAENNDKLFELRKNDRDFRLGDILRLREWSYSDGYTGRESLKRVTFIVSGLPWIADGFVCMGLQTFNPEINTVET